MGTCDTPVEGAPCPGHLGKFDDCLAQALWESGLDYADDDTGDAEFEGHLILMLMTDPETIVLDEDDADERRVLAPAGFYIVYTAGSGAVSLWTYDSEDAARKEFDDYAARYDLWDHGCDPRNPAAHKGCEDFDGCQVDW